MSESSDKPEPEQKPAGAEPVAPAPRSVKAGTPEAAPAGQISLQDLMALARTLSASGVAVDDPEGVRGTISREQRKFSRARLEGGGKPEGEPDDSVTGEGADRSSPPGSDPERTGADAAGKENALPSMTARTRRSRSSPSRGPGLLVPAAIVLTLAALAAGIWFLARIARPAPEKTPPAAGAAARPEPRLPSMSMDPRVNELADKIAEAARSNDSAKALALCVLARSEGVRIEGLAYQEARFAAASGDYPAAAIAINRSLDLGQEVSACYLLQAGILARNFRPVAILRDYEAAATAAPFEPKPFFFWGEALRRSGRPQAALVRIDEAIARATDDEMADFYRFKHRLTLIELDRAAEFTDELKARLARPAPPPDWLLTAAALEMKKGDYPAAAGFLERVAAVVPPEEIKNRLRDFFLFGFAREPALAKFFAPLLKPAPSAAGSPAPEASPAPATGLSLAPGAAPAGSPGAFSPPPPPLSLPPESSPLATPPITAPPPP